MRQGHFGVKNVHIALLTDEAVPTYEDPVHIPGTVELSLDAEIGTSASYADNDVWIDGEQDNGFTGTWSCYDIDSTTELRTLFAKLFGYTIDTKGRVVGTANTPHPFALMVERPGSVTGQRRCLLRCQFQKPSFGAATLEDNPEITQIDIPFTARKIKLPSGLVTSFYDDFTGTTTYENFFTEVDTTLAAATA